MTKPFRSDPDNIQLSDAGWHMLSTGVEITRRPLWDDANQLWARMTRGGALAWCETNNCRLPTVDELKELHSASYWIPPVTLVNTPEDKRLMMTIEYAQKHDAKVAKLFALEPLDMNATVPVANIGKCWEASGGLFGWRRKDGTYIQNGPPTYKGHGDTHLDYSSTQYVVRNPGATIPPESDEAPPKPSTVPPAPPTLRKGSKGPFVRRWQQVLLDAGHSLGSWGADGSFGEMTWAATKAWQRGRGLLDDGVVGPMTWAASATEPIPDTQRAPMRYIQARNYTKANRIEVRNIMMHTVEAPEKTNTAEAVASWFAGPDAPRASAHYCVDGDSIVGCVRETDVAWGCGGCNRYTVHYELAGYARQDGADWSDAYSQAMLRIAAKHVAATAKRWGIPIVKVGPTELRAKQRGICGHIDGTKAFRKSNHHDPGASFPWTDFLAMVEEHM